ncbi:MAG TPA: hypothetical protein VFM54_05280 [Micromonosporaceae bacterium]|nr:hypothetical protein [Micromonosporaceae bacterium]
MSARSWTVEIPAPAPWLNANGRRDRRGLAPIVKLWRDAAHTYARKAKVPKLGRVRVEACLRWADRRTRDAHNYYPTVKAAIDGLVDYGVVDDDRDAHLASVEIRCGEPITRKSYGPSGVLVLTIREAS